MKKNEPSFWGAILGISDSDIKKANDNFTSIANTFIKFQSDINNIIAQVHDFVSKHQKVFNELAEIAQNPKKLDFYFGEYSNEIHKKLQMHGYFVSLSNFKIGETSKLLKILNNNVHHEVESFLCGRLKQKGIYNSLKNEWSSNPSLNHRIKILLRGLEAHYKGDYIVSIPVLIPQIEGILFDFFINTSLFDELPKKFQGNDALTKLKKITLDEIFLEVDRMQFRRFVNRSNFYDFTDRNDILNRGKILHGTILDYDREDWSAKIIYLLDFLCNLTKNVWTVEEDKNGKYVFKKQSQFP